MSRAVLPGLLLFLASCPSGPSLQQQADFDRGDSLFLSRDEEQAFAEAAAVLAESGDVGHRIRLELHLDRDTVKRKRLPDRCLVAVALALGRYPGSSSAKDTLWAALKDVKERDGVRAACFKSLGAFHPLDLEAKVAALTWAPDDAWLADLQRRLR